MSEERTVSSRRIYDGRVIKLRVDTVIDGSGAESEREIIEHAECVAVVPVDEHGNILLVKQYRKALEKDLLEIPAGGIEPEEEPAEAVARELQEEIGYLPARMEKLCGFYSTPGFSNEYLYLYLAADLKPSRLYAEDTDSISVVRVKPEQVMGLIDSGEICDSKSIAGLLYYLEYIKK